jgi:cytochrome c oxidase assembly protein subunit 15
VVEEGLSEARPGARGAAAPVVIVPGGEDASGMATMIGGLLADNVRDFPSRARAARLARGAVVLQATDRGIAVTLSFGRGEVAVTDGATPGVAVIAGAWLDMAQLCSGQGSFAGALVRRQVRIRRGHGMAVLPVAALALSVPRSFYEPARVAERRSRWLRTATVSAAVMAFGVIVLGSVVRVTESGMGCSSWPLCNGLVGPIDRFHPLLEQVHRYAVVVLTVLVAVALLLSWCHPRPGRVVTRPAAAAAVLVVVQALLGAVTVWAHNAPGTVVLHLVMAMVLLGTLVTMAVAAWQMPHAHPGAAGSGSAASPVPPRSRDSGSSVGLLAKVTLASTLVLVASGSVVADGGASGDCRSWPVCGLDGHPEHLVVLQLVHRSVVAVVSVLLVALALHAWRAWAEVPWARGLAVVLAALLAAQVAAGALDAVLGAPDTAQDVHLALGAALWSCVVALVASAWVRPVEDRAHSPLQGRADSLSLDPRASSSSEGRLSAKERP